ncbi:MAG: hypothetical protein K2G63_03535, partial [Oscillospiraceae bacterium]|nr:hypothetical protein [Oscillospiraceae bacterium]
MNNETVGISAEIAIANTFGIKVNPNYANRADFNVVKYIQPHIKKAFDFYGIPNPKTHCAERQNPVDFILCNCQTLSVKSNKEVNGKVAPQVIGQPTSNTYFEVIDEMLNFNVVSELE